MRIAFRVYKSVVEEVSIRRHVWIEVVPVLPVGFASALIIHKETALRLVNEVPDKASLIRRVLRCLDDIPVVLQIAHRVTHGVSVLDEDEWPQEIGVGGNSAVVEIKGLREPGIHRAVDVAVGVKLGRLILYGAVVNTLQEIVGRLEDDAMTRLVAKRPDDDGRMVLVTVVHPLSSLQMSGDPLRSVSNLGIFVKRKRMALNVRLAYDVEAVDITELVPARVVGIMRSPDGIQVVALHQLNISDHVLHVDDVSMIGMRLVSVGTMDIDRLPVYQELSFHWTRLRNLHMSVP